MPYAAPAKSAAPDFMVVGTTGTLPDWSLTTIQINNIGGTCNGTGVSLPSGNYYIEIEAYDGDVSGTLQGRFALYNNTDSVTVVDAPGGGNNRTPTPDHLSYYGALVAGKEYRIRRTNGAPALWRSVFKAWKVS